MASLNVRVRGGMLALAALLHGQGVCEDAEEPAAANGHPQQVILDLAAAARPHLLDDAISV